MSQAVIEAAIVATIKLHADFDATNCYLYDRRGLGKGLARLAIVSYGQMRRQSVTIQIEQRVYSYNIDVMVPWPGTLVALDQNVATETQKVIDILAQYPRLNGTAGVTRTEMSLAATPDIITERRGSYRGRRHTLDVYETYDPSRAE